jgi:hypothetical protein
MIEKIESNQESSFVDIQSFEKSSLGFLLKHKLLRVELDHIKNLLYVKWTTKD